MNDIATELKALREEVDRLKAREQIQQQVVRYARALEWADLDLLKEVYHEDADIDFGFFKGTFADYWPIVLELEKTKDSTFHMCATVQIELDGDSAAVESYSLTVAREGALTTFFGGRYIDTFTRRHGVWKIARRVYVLDWNFDHRGNADVEQALAGLNLITERSSQHPLFRRMSVTRG